MFVCLLPLLSFRSSSSSDVDDDRKRSRDISLLCTVCVCVFIRVMFDRWLYHRSIDLLIDYFNNTGTKKRKKTAKWNVSRVKWFPFVVEKWKTITIIIINNLKKTWWLLWIYDRLDCQNVTTTTTTTKNIQKLCNHPQKTSIHTKNIVQIWIICKGRQAVSKYFYFLLLFENHDIS